jgi:hypothetical protein
MKVNVVIDNSGNISSEALTKFEEEIKLILVKKKWYHKLPIIGRLFPFIKVSKIK